MTSKYLLRVIGAICAASLSAFSSEDGFNLKREVQQSRAILAGTVESKTSYYGADGEIYTSIQFRVAANLKDGFESGNLISFTLPGGEVGDVGVLYTTVPRFLNGETALVFLDEEESGSPSFSGMKVRSKLSLGMTRIASLDMTPVELLGEMESQLTEQGLRIRPTEARAAREFFRQAESTATIDRNTVVCYALMGPKWANGAASYKLDTTTIPSTFISAVVAAASVWNTATSPFRFVQSASSANVVRFGAINQSGVLAQTRVNYFPSNNTMAMFTLTYNTNFQWSTTGQSGRFDVQGIGAHEFGHALGLDHPPDPSCSEQTMWWSAGAAETKKRTIEQGDIDGEVALYPAPSGGGGGGGGGGAPSGGGGGAPSGGGGGGGGGAPPSQPAAPTVVRMSISGTLQATKPMTIVAFGSGWDTSTLQFVIVGPGCPAAGCVVSGSAIRPLSSSQGQITFTPSRRGDFTVNLRQTDTGLPSTLTLRFTIRP